jgi:protein tyrosine/serine phosphatase
LIEGSLLAGEYPGSFNPVSARLRLARFLDAGIRTFINLTEAREPLAPYDEILAELAAERGIDARQVRHPIRDGGVPHEREVMIRILATIRDEIAAGRSVYVHCWGGIGRTGTVAGCWLVEGGLAGPEALSRIAALRQHIPDYGMRSPETDQQCLYVCEWSGVER